MNILIKKNIYILNIKDSILVKYLLNSIFLEEKEIDKIFELFNINENSYINIIIIKKILKIINYIILDEFFMIDNKLILIISKKLNNNLLRFPIISVIGHVDNGKTSILEKILNINLTKNEIGGITQYIKILNYNNKKNNLIFIDTPGHESFLKIIENCINLSDILVFVIATDNINNINNFIKIINNKLNNVIILINKIDKIKNIEIIKTKLYKYNLVSKDSGGNYDFIYYSKYNNDINKLIDVINEKSKKIDLTYSDNNISHGTILEFNLYKRIGYFILVIIKDGTVNTGDLILIKFNIIKIKFILDINNNKIYNANPCTPIKIFGISYIKNIDIGDNIIILKNYEDIKVINNFIKKNKNEINKLYNNNINSSNLNIINNYENKRKILNFILKTNTLSINNIINKLINEISIKNNLLIKIINCGIGDINDNDVYMAFNLNSEILGFNVKINSKSLILINKFNLKYNIYYVIYNLLDYINKSIKEIYIINNNNEIGKANIINIFNINNTNVIGCKLSFGYISKNNIIKIFRKDILLFSGYIYSMKFFKKNIDKVNDINTEFGISLIDNKKNNNFKKGDLIYSYLNNNK